MANRLLLSASLLTALSGAAPLAGVAQAHAILVDGSPAAGAKVPAGDVAIAFRFNSRVDAARSRLQLTDGHGDKTVLPIAAADARDDGPAAGAMLHAAAHLEPGDYVIRWQVLAIDGHITRGDVPFTVVPAGGAPLASVAP
jgi:methionine-rich copper-binding protein CopC